MSLLQEAAEAKRNHQALLDDEDLLATLGATDYTAMLVTARAARDNAKARVPQRANPLDRSRYDRGDDRVPTSLRWIQ